MAGDFLGVESALKEVYSLWSTSLPKRFFLFDFLLSKAT